MAQFKQKTRKFTDAEMDNMVKLVELLIEIGQEDKRRQRRLSINERFQAHYARIGKMRNTSLILTFPAKQVSICKLFAS